MFMARSSRALAAGGAALVLAAGTLAGCGGSDSSTTATTTATTLTITGASAAYAPIRVEIVGIGKDIGTAIEGARSSTDAQLADQFSALTVRVEGAVARLERLTVPASLRTALDQLQQALTIGAADLRAVATAARRHDAQAAKEAAQRLAGDSAGIRQARAAVEQQLHSARG
jgi:hypothetical protein